MKTKKKHIPIGISNFKRIIDDNLYYVDKTLLIKDIVDSGTLVYLFPRPRRFGKTLNLSMLKYFYSCSADYSYLFKDLAISKEEEIMEKQGKHPVIYLTFKDVKDKSCKESFTMIYDLITELYSNTRYLINDDKMSEREKRIFNKILDGTASHADYKLSLKQMCKYLYEFHQTNPVILIDEYDTPIHAGYTHDYYDEIVAFMRDFMSGALKDNEHLEKAIITGILRVSQESIFTGLNNIEVFSMLSEISNDKFGFTEEEVKEMLAYRETTLDFEAIKKHYNGYNFSGIDIYNPWSILNSVKNNKLGYYWLNTSSNLLIKKMCQEADDDVKHDLQVLVNGGRIEKYVNEDFVFPELITDKNLIWSFFMLCGYLRYDNYVLGKRRYEVNAELSIPNEEIAYIFDNDVIPIWLMKKAKKDIYLNLANLLINGDLQIFQKDFKEFCMTSFSYHDVGYKEAESFYHAFVLGMLSCLKESYQIRSNRESGLGRYDIMLIPNDKSARGIIFEFKNLNSEYLEDNIEDAIESAKDQVNKKKYRQELMALGVENIVHLIAVFKGKEVETAIL